MNEYVGHVSIAPSAIIGKNVKIGNDTIIQHGAYIEHDCIIGKNCRIGTYTVLRPHTIIGDHSIIGNLSCCEGHTIIGNHVTFHSQCHITAHMLVEDWVFIGPNLTTTNTKQIKHGRENIQLILKGPTVRFGARIGGGVTLLPRVEIGREAMIGAGAVVTKEVLPFKIAVGVPAKMIKDIPNEEFLPNELFQEFIKRRQNEKDEEQ